MNGQAILTDLKGESNEAFGEMYKKHFGQIQNFILKNSGTAADAEDIFQDTMLVLIEKLRRDKFILTASLQTYLTAIAKHLWINKIRHQKIETNFLEENANSFYQEIDTEIDSEKTYKDKLQTYLHKITAHCKGLIHDMFFKEKSIVQIQKQYGYSTKHNAINQKYKCIEQIRKVKENELKK